MNILGMPRMGSGKNASVRASSHSAAYVRRHSPISGGRKSPHPSYNRRFPERSSSEDAYSQNQGMPVVLKSGSPALRLRRILSASSGLFIYWARGPMYLWARMRTSKPDVTIKLMTAQATRQIFVSFIVWHSYYIHVLSIPHPLCVHLNLYRTSCLCVYFHLYIHIRIYTNPRLFIGSLRPVAICPTACQFPYNTYIQSRSRR